MKKVDWTNCKLIEQDWRIPREIATYVSDFHYGSFLCNREFAYISTITTNS